MFKGPGDQKSTQIDKKARKNREKFKVGGQESLKFDFEGQKWTQEDDFGAQEADFGGSGLPRAAVHPPPGEPRVNPGTPPPVTHLMRV